MAFEYLTIKQLDNFWPFKYKTSSVSRSPLCIRMNINLIFIPESTVETSNDDIDILEERVEVHDGQLAQVLQRHVPDVVVVMKLSWERPAKETKDPTKLLNLTKNQLRDNCLRMIAHMAERSLRARRTRVRIPALAPYEIAL